MLDLIVVGAGLSGLFAGVLAARRGLQTLVLAQGVGATHVGTGCIDVLGYDDRGRLLDEPLAALPAFCRANPGHPYAVAGLDALRAGLAELQDVCEAAGWPLTGELTANYWLPTAAGAVRPACLVPESMTGGEVRRPEPMTLCSLPGFRDYEARFAADNLRRQRAGLEVEVRDLSLPGRTTRREAYATDMARWLDDPANRARVAKVWKPRLEGASRAGLPAVLGLANAHAARCDLAERLRVELFEIPLLPPSVPGMRLYSALAHTLESLGSRLVLGPRAVGAVDGSGPAPRVRGIVAEAAGRSKTYQAGAVLLASGGFLGGGLAAPRAGIAVETVFDLPVVSQEEGRPWFAETLFGPHPFVRFGLRVDEAMRPLDAAGAPLYENLYAAGEILGAADRLAEGSREGISIATAYKAVSALTAGK